ncbi:exopolygalacturonase PelB [Opitutales bacterium ASA1]|uniref:glycoside hydrolase family 28 protein n=1 Tax=Congregicoccus parvus TaxID=3081749 RepID=UPI002B28FEB4|nr:exopolygalacturonase PelB [Opitutales bacterium ASA1]
MQPARRVRSLTQFAGLSLALSLASSAVVPSVAVEPPRARHEKLDTKDEILARIVPPRISEREFRVSDLGAVPDGTADSRPAFVRAMEASRAAGGGRIVVGPGVYRLDGPIHFVSDTALHLEEGATLRFSSEASHYLPVVATSWEGTLLHNYSPFIYARGCENIAITGRGTIDGEASRTWQLWREKQEADQLLSRRMNNSGVPVAERIFGEGHFLRPHLVQFYECRNILIEGVRFEDSPFWCVHLLMCRNVTVRGASFDAHNKNNDGIDPEYSEDVLIEDVDFDNGDDNVAIKAGRDHEGRTLGLSSRNIIVRNCRLKGLHGIVIGSEMSAGVYNVFVEDCVASGYLKRGLYVKSNPDRGGSISDIHFRNVKLDLVEDAFFITSFYHQQGSGHATDIHSIHVENVYCREATAAGIVVHGFAEKPVRDIRFRNVVIEKAAVGLDLRHAHDIVMDDVSIGGRVGPPSSVK